MVSFKTTSGHHAIHFQGAIWLRTMDGFRAISKDEARLLLVHFRTLRLTPDPVFSAYASAVFWDLHEALTDLRNEARAELRRKAA